jgi:hypothetical protein
MFAVIAAVLLVLVAFGASLDAVDLFVLALASWAFHFAWDFRPWHR